MNEENDSDLGSDVEDHRLKPTDLILVTASVEEDAASLEMHVYDTETGSLYVHHDIALPAYPLCVEFVGCDGAQYNWSEKSRAFVAVGTFEPWNPAETSVLLTASFDRTVCVLDARSPAKVAKHATRASDVEDIAWDLHNPALFAVATEDGYVSMMDVRVTRGALLAWNAHNKACASICSNAYAPHVWSTCSTDKTIRLWDLADGNPVCISTKNAGVGKLFACEFSRGCPEEPLLLAVGGSKGLVAIWHPMDDDATMAEKLPMSRTLSSPVAWPKSE